MISRPALREMHTQQMAVVGFPADEAIGPMSYGLGWFIQPYRGKYRVHHGGNIDGFSALVTFYPFDRVGIVVLTNKNGTGLPELASRWIADRALGLEPREWDRQALQNLTQATQMQQEAESRLAGERVRLTVQLIEAAPDAHLWTEVYEVDLAPVTTIATEAGHTAKTISRAVRRLGLHRSSRVTTATKRRPHPHADRPGGIDPEWLRQRYVVDGPPMARIAGESEVSTTTVYRAMQHHGIDRRSSGKRYREMTES